jgi:hypothetical protein
VKKEEGDETMIRYTKVTGSDALRRGLFLAVGLLMTCALADRAQAAGSQHWQVFDPFTLKSSPVAPAAPVDGMVRLKAETTSASANQAAMTLTMASISGTGVRATNVNLRQPPIRVPYKPRFRSAYCPPGFGCFGN